MTRNKMISALTDNMVDSLRSDHYYCASIVRSGFVGFYDYTNQELVDAYSQIFDEQVNINE